MKLPNITFKCPKCGNRSIKVPTGRQNKTVTCGGCGHRGPLNQFADAPSRKRVLDHVSKLMRDAFKNIKGFK